MIEVARSLLKTIFSVAFGSDTGNFGYPIAARPSLAMVVVGLVVLAAVLVAVRFSVPRVPLDTPEGVSPRMPDDKPEGLSPRVPGQGVSPQLIALWIVLACAAHLAFAQLAYAPQRAVIESDASNGFYNVSQKYSASELLSRFDELAVTFTTHPRANLPGKTLFYKALELVTNSPQGLVCLIILISNLGGVLVYAVARQWFQDPLTAFYALVLYLFLPARIYFFPLLNTISPVLLFLVFWLVTRYLASKRHRDLIFAGVALFALTMFDPLPLVALPMLAVVVLLRILDGSMSWGGAVAMAAWIALGFAVMYLAFRMLFGFDLISAFQFVVHDARAFNIRSNRPYSVWVVHNVKDFFLNVGIAQTIVFVAFTVSLIRRLMTGGSSLRLETWLTLTFLAVLFGLDAAGVNRGESVRLWIFLGVLMQILVARALAIWSQRRLFVPVLSASILQTALCVRIVAWIIP